MKNYRNIGYLLLRCYHSLGGGNNFVAVSHFSLTSGGNWSHFHDRYRDRVRALSISGRFS